MKKVSKKFRNIRSKKETLVQVFSCEFLEISKNTFFTFGRVLLTVRRSSLHLHSVLRKAYFFKLC